MGTPRCSASTSIALDRGLPAPRVIGAPRKRLDGLFHILDVATYPVRGAREATGYPTFQMSCAYSRIVRSLENFPERATFTRHFRVQAEPFW